MEFMGIYIIKCSFICRLLISCDGAFFYLFFSKKCPPKSHERIALTLCLLSNIFFMLIYTAVYRSMKLAESLFASMLLLP